MNVRPCYNCALRFTGERPHQVRCKILDEKLTHITPGSGITSIDFQCPTRDAIFKPGEPIIFEAYSRDQCERGLSDYCGWVWKMRGRKVVVLSNETDKPMLTFYTGQLTKDRGGDWKRCCIHCGKPEDMMMQVWKEHSLPIGENDKPGLQPYVCRSDWDDIKHVEIHRGCEFKEEPAL